MNNVSKPQERRSQSLSTGALPRRRSRATKRGRGEIWRKASRRQVRWWAEGTALSPVRIPLPLICPCLLFFDSRGRSFEQKPACLTLVQEGFAKSQQRLTTSHRVREVKRCARAAVGLWRYSNRERAMQQIVVVRSPSSTCSLLATPTGPPNSILVSAGLWGNMDRLEVPK